MKALHLLARMWPHARPDSWVFLLALLSCLDTLPSLRGGVVLAHEFVFVMDDLRKVVGQGQVVLEGI